MPKPYIPHKIVWLASYPKSGNTWFRAFLSALMNEGSVDINNLHTGGIFSDRLIFNLATDIDSSDLYDEEAKAMMADAYRGIAAQRDFLSIIKVHDAFLPYKDGPRIIPEDTTLCALYFIRNPLDVAGSLANHLDISIEQAVTMLNKSNAKLSVQKNNLNKLTQFQQYLLDWSSHVSSWTEEPSFPVLVVRYEDMQANTFETFKRALDHIGWECSHEEIERALAASNFNNLRKQEVNSGFAEKVMRQGSRFFRSGKMRNWEQELTTGQIDSIIAAHEEVMQRYQYSSTL